MEREINTRDDGREMAREAREVAERLGDITASSRDEVPHVTAGVREMNGDEQRAVVRLVDVEGGDEAAFGGARELGGEYAVHARAGRERRARHDMLAQGVRPMIVELCRECDGSGTSAGRTGIIGHVPGCARPVSGETSLTRKRFR